MSPCGQGGAWQQRVPAPPQPPPPRAGTAADVTVRRQGARDGCCFSRGQFHGALYPIRRGRGWGSSMAEKRSPLREETRSGSCKTLPGCGLIRQTRVESTLREAGCFPAPRQRELLASFRTVVSGGACSPGNETVRATCPPNHGTRSPGLRTLRKSQAAAILTVSLTQNPGSSSQPVSPSPAVSWWDGHPPPRGRAPSHGLAQGRT